METKGTEDAFSTAFLEASEDTRKTNPPTTIRPVWLDTCSFCGKDIFECSKSHSSPIVTAILEYCEKNEANKI